jgi:hypothetical protein
MFASLAVLSILAQDVAPPPPPPPLLPANPSPYNDRYAPGQAIPPPPPAPPASPPVEETARADTPSIPTGTRMVGSVGAGILGAAATTGGLVYATGHNCNGSASCNAGNVYLGFASVLVGAALISLGAWGAHRIMGGRSSVGWSLLGTFAGAALGFFGTLVGDSYANAGSARGLSVPVWGYSVITTALAAVGAGLMPEIGNALVLRQEAQSVATPGRF